MVYPYDGDIPLSSAGDHRGISWVLRDNAGINDPVRDPTATRRPGGVCAPWGLSTHRGLPTRPSGWLRRRAQLQGGAEARRRPALRSAVSLLAAGDFLGPVWPLAAWSRREQAAFSRLAQPHMQGVAV